jgi:segregation and condensation protein A
MKRKDTLFREVSTDVMSFEVQLEQYAGPLHLLLELIEKQKLPITDVSLAQVTEAYLAYINVHEPPPEELADFLMIATRLLLIKSHEILPREETILEETETSLAAQLQLYKLFARAADLIDITHQSPDRSFDRGYADVLKHEKFVFPKDLTTLSLSNAFIGLLKRLEPFFRIQQAAIERMVSVKERLQEIRHALLTRARMTFKDMISNGRSKVEIVVSFLALLELLKQKSIHVVQSGHFGEIKITRVE